MSRFLCTEDEIENNVYLAMCFFGENYVYEKEREAARIFLSSALSITADYKISFAFAMLLITYLTNLPDTNELVKKQQLGEQFLEYAINLLDGDETACQKFQNDFPFFVNKFEKKCKQFISEVRKKQRKNLTLENMDLLRSEEQKRLQAEETSLRNLERTEYPTVNLLSEHFALLCEIALRAVFQIDRQRIEQLIRIAERLSDVEKQSEYIVKERILSETETATQALEREINDKPTSLSLQHIRVLLGKIQNKVAELQKKNLERAESQITLVNPLQDDNYVLVDGRVRLVVNVQLQRGTAPIQNLEVKIIPMKSASTRRSPKIDCVEN
ncbi:MAG: hypothetical protein LBT05_11300 [Planctomycetaceae bacterium]|jgi:hypothetical protein|nr:hypothetical protein [Planctomycetaceae bacterium]